MPASRLIMVRPSNFGSNPETLGDNVFQSTDAVAENAASLAIEEFDNMVDQLEMADIEVKVFQDPGTEIIPDAVFPNNWFSTHEDGQLITYPMMSSTRRLERKPEFMEAIHREFVVVKYVDLSPYELEGEFLEGTGSMVLDHEAKIAYVCDSERCSNAVLEDFCQMTGFSPFVFEAEVDGKPVYHTNVVMSVGSGYVVACVECIKDAERFIRKVEETGKELISINLDQLRSFMGNCIEVQNRDGDHLLVLSATAYSALKEEQKHRLSKFVAPLPIAIPTIEKYGGGSVRCMIAENYLTKK